LSVTVQKNSERREMGFPILLGPLILAALLSLPVAIVLFTAAPTHCFMSLKNDTGEELLVQAELYRVKKADGTPEKLVERLTQSLKPAQARIFDVSKFEARLLFTAAGASTQWADSRVADDLWGGETMTLHLMPGGTVQESRDFGR